MSSSRKAFAGDPASEWKRSNPDLVVYVPKGEEHCDTDNEHFLVFIAPDGEELLAMWTQSSVEGHGDNHTMLARSADGIAWSEPTCIAGTCPGSGHKQASWAFPVVSAQGRIYCFYTRELDITDLNQMGGAMGCAYSDDAGRSWQRGADIPMPRNRYDNPDPSVGKNWIAWQKPIRDGRGRQFLGYTQWTSKAVVTSPPTNCAAQDSRCAFMRFENIDEGLDPEAIEVTWLPASTEGLAVPARGQPDISVCQEPSPVLLPDGRIFVAMRTLTGTIWYSVSDDDGATWREPQMLRHRDGGDGIQQPWASCPIYELANGRFLLVFHNNGGTKGAYSQYKEHWEVNQANHIRDPAFIAVGQYRADADQPIWFSEPLKILDTDGVPIGPKGTAEIATYPSLTEFRGRRVLWYPDRKYYLLGKYITDEMLAGLVVP